jgi:hypothetical protein
MSTLMYLKPMAVDLKHSQSFFKPDNSQDLARDSSISIGFFRKWDENLVFLDLISILQYQNSGMTVPY